jgi:hypothetical protein
MTTRSGEEGAAAPRCREPVRQAAAVSNNDYGYGYDPAQADIRGRFVFVSLGVKW